MPAAENTFDPLASLFDAPPLGGGQALPPIDDDGEPELSRSFGASEPAARHHVMRRGAAPLFDPADADAPDPPAALRDRAPSLRFADEPDEVATERYPVEDDPSVELPALAALPEARPEASLEGVSSPEDRAALAKRLAAEAIARSRAAAPPAEDKAALAKRLAAEAIARSRAAAPPAEDKAALAKRLAAEAMARTQPATPAKGASPKKAASQKAASQEAASQEAMSSAPRSRIERLTSRAKRPRSALDAIREAAEAERLAKEQAAADSARQAVVELADRVGDILRRQLPGVVQLEVANAMLVDDRNMMRALWKGHRARFAAQGLVDQVVSTTHVLRALDAVGANQLAAAIVHTSNTDYLVFIDVGTQATVAAFADARAWYAGLRS